MKKIIITLVFTLCLSLFGCGQEKSGADYMFEAFDNIAAENTLASKAAEEVRIKLSVEDISSLFTLFGLDTEGLPQIKNAYYDICGAGEYASQTLSVTLDDKPLSFTLFNDLEKFILSSPQLSENYGVTLSEYWTLMEKLSGVDMPYSYEDLQQYNDPTFFAEISTRYGEKFETLTRENIEFTTEEDGKNVLVSFMLTPENVTEIVYTLVTYLQADTELLDWIGKVYGEEIVTQITASELNKGDMLTELTDTGFVGDVTLTIQKKNSELLAANVNITADDVPVTMQYANNETGLTASVKSEDILVEMVSKATEETFACTVKATENGTEILQLALDVADDAVLSVTAEGVTLSLLAEYTVTDTTLEATLTEINMAGFGLDISDIGIKLLVDSEVEMPVLPEEYISVANYSTEEFQAIFFEFIQNSGLLSYMQ